MFAVLHAVAIVIANLFKSRRRLRAENLLLRHQLNVDQRRALSRLRLIGVDQSVRVWMTRLWSDVCAENLIRIDWGRESPNLGRP